MLIFNYSSKKELKESIGKRLSYDETSIFGPEYVDNGEVYGSNRPQITRNKGREFYAKVRMVNGLIAAVE